MKKDCFRRKVNFIFKREKERFKFRENKKDERKKIQKRKEEQKNLEKKIFKLKLEHMEFKIRKTEKGDVISIDWKEKQIGDYICPGLPETILKNFIRINTNGSMSMCSWRMEKPSKSRNYIYTKV